MSKPRTDYPQEELVYAEAIRYVEDHLEAACLPIILIGDVAERLFNKKTLANLKKIEFGVKEKSLSRYALNTLRDRLGTNWKKISYQGIPVEIKIIKNDKGFLKNPDTTYFWGGAYQIPNPFDKYYKMRGLII